MDVDLDLDRVLGDTTGRPTSILDGIFKLLGGGSQPAHVATAVVGSATLLFFAWRLRWALGLAPLYARIRGEDVADHPIRARILAALADAEEVGTRELAALGGSTRGTLRHHLKVLSRTGLARSRRVGRDRVWSLSAKPRANATVLVPARRAILAALAARPGLRPADLGRVLGCSRANAHHHVRALEAGGLVVVAREGGRARCYLAA